MMALLEGLYRRLRFGKPIVVVSGLPRSGTSMTMKMLEAGGVPIVTDGKRTADESNPKGYFEFEPVMRLHEDPDKRWLVEARGKAVKIISFLLASLPETHNYKVIFMHRDLYEVMASQSKMLEQRGAPKGAEADAHVRANMHGHVLSIDVDDQVVAASQLRGRPLPRGYAPRLRRDIERTLEILSGLGSRATFFVNAQYCDGRDDLFERIIAQGHVLASHGFEHRDVRSLSLTQFRDDVSRSLTTLTRYQRQILGYRPPGFTMPYRTQYFRILEDLGFTYVSSGAGLNRGGVPDAAGPVPIHGGLQHVPISTTRVPGTPVKYPIGYCVVSRLLPQSFYLRSVDRWLRHQRFFHYYAHTFEISGLEVGGYPRTWAPIPVLYRLRCRDREDLYRAIADRVRFTPIEAALAVETG